MSEQLNQTEEIPIDQSSSKKTIRFVEEDTTEGSHQPTSQLNRSVNTSRAVSDSTHDDEIDQDDNEESRFKHIKRIEKVSQSGEGRNSEQSSPSSRRMDKSGIASSVHSGDENLSVHFGGEEVIIQDEQEPHKFEYEPDDIPLKSILKSDLNRSRNISFDVRILKDIEGKLISHENLSDDGGEGNEEEGGKSTHSILKDAQLMEQFVSGISSNNEDSDGDEQDFLEDLENDEKEYREGEVRFKIGNEEGVDKVSEQINQKRNSLLFPAYSILKNSPLVQPSEFKALKNIEKVSHNSRHNSEYEEEEEDDDADEPVESDLTKQVQSSEDIPDVRFVGDIILQDSNTYKFKYNPEENPKRSSIKRGSCHLQGIQTNLAQAGGNQQNSMNSSCASAGQSKGKETRETRKRKSYDFLNLKNVEGKMIKHWQDEEKTFDDSEISVEPEAPEDCNSPTRDIKFGGIQIFLEQSDQIEADKIPQVNKTAKPQKPILKPMQNNNSGGHTRSSSCDFKRTIKNIDGVYRRRNQKQNFKEDEEEKIVHFSGIVAPESSNSPKTEQIENEQHSFISQSEKTDKKSILKRSMSLQGRSSPNIFVSKESTPVARKSNFQLKNVEGTNKESKDIPTPETFSANWISIRNDYIESGYKFLTRLDPTNLSATFPKGIDNSTFNQMIDIIHSKLGENGEFVKTFMEHFYQVRNFSSLILVNQHLSESLQDILISLRQSHLIDQQQFHKLRQKYILKL